MPVEIDILNIRTRLNQHGVAIEARVYPLLDGGIIGGDINDGGGGGIHRKQNNYCTKDIYSHGNPR